VAEVTKLRNFGTITLTTVFETAKAGHGDRSGYTSLENRMIKMQTTLVACPRNHLYRTDHRVIEGNPFCFVFSAELDHFPRSPRQSPPLVPFRSGQLKAAMGHDRPQGPFCASRPAAKAHFFRWFAGR